MPPTNDRAGNEWVPVGSVRRPAGLKGEIAITAYGDDPARFPPGMPLQIRGAQYQVSSSRRGPRSSILLRLDGIDDVDAAGALRGAEILADPASLPDQPQGVYYHYQLIGLTVRTVAGDNVGELVEIMETGGNDVYVVKAVEGQEILVPAVADVIVEVDLADGIMKIDPPRGLLQ